MEAKSTGETVPKPVNAAEVLALWREVLGQDDATPEDNFFEAGGTSLSATRLASRLSALSGVKVSAADVLAHPSVRQLAQRLSGPQLGLDREGSNQRAAQQRQAFSMSRPVRITR